MSEIFSTLTIFSIAICVIATISLVMFVKKLRELKVPKQQEAGSEQKPQAHTLPTPEDIGVVVDEKYITFQGRKLEYFVLKKSSGGNDRLPVGTKVKVLKKSSSEAHVEPLKDQ
jgi:hypothetical protein